MYSANDHLATRRKEPAELVGEEIRSPNQGCKKQVAPVTAITALREVRRQVVETGWLQVARIDRLGRICSLFSAEDHIPKLDAAGSNPVSRSTFSITSSQIRYSDCFLNAVIAVTIPGTC